MLMENKNIFIFVQKLEIHDFLLIYIFCELFENPLYGWVSIFFAPNKLILLIPFST